jgi:hypothetical protein
LFFSAKAMPVFGALACQCCWGRGGASGLDFDLPGWIAKHLDKSHGLNDKSSF